MKNQNGFGVVGLLVLMPFILSILAAISAAALAFKADAHLKHECRTSVLTSQRDAAEKLKQLIKLNPRAKTLRRQKKIADKALRVATAAAAIPVIGPAGLATARAYVATVNAMRVALAFQQKKLLIEGKALSYSAPMRARSAVMSGLSNEIALNRGSLPKTRSSFRLGRFNVKATPEKDLTPDYNPADTFEKDQVVDLNVTIDVASLLPEWLRKLLPNGKLEINSHCQATIEKKENSWVETLNAVR